MERPTGERVTDEGEVRRRLRLMLLPLGVLFPVALGLGVFGWVQPGINWLHAVVLVVCGGFAAWRLRVRYREALRVVRTDYRVCLHCGQDLSGLEDEGVCPECAKGYTRAFLIEDWQKRCAGFLTPRTRKGPRRGGKRDGKGGGGTPEG